MNTVAKRTPGPYTVEKDPALALMGGRGSRKAKKWRVLHDGQMNPDAFLFNSLPKEVSHG